MVVIWGDVWTYTNVPAVAEIGIVDALGRAPGVAMTSALGYTAEHYAAARRTSGERAWYALYMGSPTTPSGAVIKTAWLDAWRLVVAPPRPVKCVVGVDPSDSGSGDDCGLIAASITSDGVVALIADVSEPLTSDAWASRAVELALGVGASEIAVEAYSARETYVRVVKEALKRYSTTYPIKVTGWPPRGSGRGGGDAIARSAGLIQGLEVGSTRIVGHLPEFEIQATGWQQGQHQPDCVAAAVIAHDVLTHSLGQQWNLVSPLDLERRMRERERDPGRTGRFAGRLGSRDLTPIDSRLTRRISGAGYDPLAHFGQVLG